MIPVGLLAYCEWAPPNLDQVYNLDSFLVLDMLEVRVVLFDGVSLLQK